MFGMGVPEILLILAVALIVFGPKKLPELAKSLGHAIHEFRKATTDFKETMEENTGIKEVKKAISDVNIKDIIDITAKTPDKQTEKSDKSITETPKDFISTDNAEKNTELKQKGAEQTEKHDK